jgi:S1-C subfamily serine protease
MTRRIVLLCLGSAMAGAWAAQWWRRPLWFDAPLAAQEAAAWPVTPAPQGNAAPRASMVEPPELAELTPDERVNVSVYQQTNRGVVNINTTAVQGDRFLLFEVLSEGEGSGTVIDRLGHVLTNFHVVDGAREVRVTLFDGKSYEAKLVGGDIQSDVAVLKIDAPPASLFPVALGNSSRLLVGQRVFAIGNPFGLERTLSTGIVSYLNRSLPSRRNGRTMRSIIQIDAAINPGSSGGPLLDSHGRMIGMTTAIASKSGESAGVGFAIPSDTINRVLPQLIKNGRVRRPDSGIVRVYPTDHGLLISTLARGGPAERAGLRGPQVRRQGPFGYGVADRSAADLIVAVDGESIKTADDFLNAIDSKHPGDQVILTVIRGGQQLHVPLRLEAGD